MQRPTWAEVDLGAIVANHAVLASLLDPGALPVLDERQFHVRDHAQNGDHHPPHASGRRHLRLKHPQ